LIVADTNLVVALVIQSAQTPLAEQVWAKDPVWLVPPLARSEFTYTFSKLLTGGRVGPGAIAETFLHFARAVTVASPPDLQAVLERSFAHRSSTYDTEFALLAEANACQVATFDQVFAERFRGRVVTPAQFLEVAV
jgi:predicted nucleic acid-binding protein